jgi:hypothetical protein
MIHQIHFGQRTIRHIEGSVSNVDTAAYPEIVTPRSAKNVSTRSNGLCKASSFGARGTRFQLTHVS